MGSIPSQGTIRIKHMDDSWKKTLSERIDEAQRASSMRRKPRDIEHALQVQCVRWFDCQYSPLSKCLFAIPNGGRRDKLTGAKLKAEGVRAGVADLFLCIAASGKHGLFIEMKTEENGSRQSEAQKEFASIARDGGYGYEVCRSLDEFVRIISEYMNDVLYKETQI